MRSMPAASMLCGGRRANPIIRKTVRGVLGSMTHAVSKPAPLRLSPVPASVSPSTPTTLVPWAPRKRLLRPAITSAAMRPCRLAGPASGTSVCAPVTQSTVSTASPVCKTAAVQRVGQPGRRQ